MSEEKFIGLNIAFRVPEEVAEAAIKLSKEIAENEDTYFILDGVNYFPHITNYRVEIPEKNLEKLTEAVDKLSEGFLPIELIFDKCKADSGWIAPYFKYTAQLRTLHSKFIETLNVFREGHIREKFRTSNEFSSKEERENIAKYGHPWVFDRYDPHLTITRLKDETRAKDVAGGADWTIKNFKADSIGIFVSGEHGTCRKLIKEFKLG